MSPGKSLGIKIKLLWTQANQQHCILANIGKFAMYILANFGKSLGYGANF